MLGPKQRQLATYVASANDGSLDSAGQQWKTGESLLRRLASQLETRSGQIGTDHRFSGESAKAASTAFSHSATKMADRADEMRDGAAAFADAAHAVRQAQKASDSFAKHSGDQPPQQPPDLSDASAQRDWKTKNNQFWNNFGDRETQAHEATTALTDNHTTQAAVFAKIHGEAPPPPPPGPSGGGPLHTGTPTTTTHVPLGGGPGNHGHIDTPSDDPGNDHTGNGDPGDDHTGNDDPGNDHTGNDDPGQPTTPGSRRVRPRTRRHPSSRVVRCQAAFPAAGVGGGVGAAGGVGAVAGGALGGMAAAGLAAGGLNGMVPVGGGGVRGGLVGQWRARHRSDLAHGCGLGPGPWHGCCGPSGRRGRAGAAGRAGAGGMAGRSGRPQRQPQRGQPRVAGPGGRARCRRRCRGRCRPWRQGQEAPGRGARPLRRRRRLDRRRGRRSRAARLSAAEAYEGHSLATSVSTS